MSCGALHHCAAGCQRCRKQQSSTKQIKRWAADLPASSRAMWRCIVLARLSATSDSWQTKAATSLAPRLHVGADSEAWSWAQSRGQEAKVGDWGHQAKLRGAVTMHIPTKQHQQAPMLHRGTAHHLRHAVAAPHRAPCMCLDCSQQPAKLFQLSPLLVVILAHPQPISRLRLLLLPLLPLLLLLRRRRLLSMARRSLSAAILRLLHLLRASVAPHALQRGEHNLLLAGRVEAADCPNEAVAVHQGRQLHQGWQGRACSAWKRMVASCTASCASIPGAPHAGCISLPWEHLAPAHACLQASQQLKTQTAARMQHSLCRPAAQPAHLRCGHAPLRSAQSARLGGKAVQRRADGLVEVVNLLLDRTIERSEEPGQGHSTREGEHTGRQQADGRRGQGVALAAERDQHSTAQHGWTLPTHPGPTAAPLSRTRSGGLLPGVIPASSKSRS